MEISSVSDPEAHFNDLRQNLPPGQLRAFSFAHRAFYRQPPERDTLLAVVACSGELTRFLIAPAAQSQRQRVSDCSDDGCLENLAETLKVPVFEYGAPASLVPEIIPKPWGREIWYTGMEVRGQAGVGDERAVIPLPWLLELLPEAFAMGSPQQLILLKVLDPLADEVFGDLYFEMHERKREVYVVTHIDKRAWPDGVGGIRFGFCPQKRRAYDNDADFKAAYGSAVAAYEKVRRQIDDRLDKIKAGVGMDVNAPVPPRTMSAWLENIEAPLRERERELREHMDSYAQILPLSIGDVVKVPCYTPHSLLHGVRTVEFQTPVYERKILAFAQKVLTQEHWDTREALEKVNLHAPVPKVQGSEELAPGLTCQKIVDFDDFTVWRLRAHSQCDYSLAGLASYRLVMAVKGEVTTPGKVLAPEQALLVPAGAGAHQRLSLAAGAVALIAAPKAGKC